MTRPGRLVPVISGPSGHKYVSQFMASGVYTSTRLKCFKARKCNTDVKVALRRLRHSTAKIMFTVISLSLRDTTLYKPYNIAYAPPQNSIVFAPFLSENGYYRLCPFWSGIEDGFRGNYESVWTYLSFQFQMSKKKKEKYGMFRNGL